MTSKDDSKYTAKEILDALVSLTKRDYNNNYTVKEIVEDVRDDLRAHIEANKKQEDIQNALHSNISGQLLKLEIAIAIILALTGASSFGLDALVKAIAAAWR